MSDTLCIAKCCSQAIETHPTSQKLGLVSNVITSKALELLQTLTTGCELKGAIKLPIEYF